MSPSNRDVERPRGIVGANPFEYLVAILRHHDEVAAHPADWMPWNFTAALARLTSDTVPPR